MYGELHVRSRVKYTYFVGFATLVLDFFFLNSRLRRFPSHTHENQEKPKRPGEVAPVFARLPCFN